MPRKLRPRWAAVLATVAVVATTHSGSAQPMQSPGSDAVANVASTRSAAPAPTTESSSTRSVSPEEDARGRALYENWLTSNYGTTTYLQPANYSDATYRILGGSVLLAGGLTLTLFAEAADEVNSFFVALGLLTGGCGLYLLVTGIISAVEARGVEVDSRLPTWDAALLVEPTGGSAVLHHRF